MKSNRWDLKIEECYAAVYYGQDEELRSTIYLSLIKKFTDDKTKRCLQIGVPHCVSHKYGDNWTALDPYDQRPCIDVREKLEETTLPNDSFDFIVCNAVLEHVEDPFGCVKAMHRIAKPNATIWCEVPFVQPYHPHKKWTLDEGLSLKRDKLMDDEDHGGDYWRFTPQGLEKLMQPFELIQMLLINQGGICFYGRKKDYLGKN